MCVNKDQEQRPGTKTRKNTHYRGISFFDQAVQTEGLENQSQFYNNRINMSRVHLNLRSHKAARDDIEAAVVMYDKWYNGLAKDSDLVSALITLEQFHHDNNLCPCCAARCERWIDTIAEAVDNRLTSLNLRGE